MVSHHAACASRQAAWSLPNELPFLDEVNVTDLPPVEYRGIRFTAEHIAILDGSKQLVTVPLGNVRSITLRRGFTAERPVLEALLGLACGAVGLVAVRSAVLWVLGSRLVSGRLILLALLLPLGGSLLREATRYGFYLRADLDRGSRKFPIVGGLDAGFLEFIRQAQNVSGKPIDVSDYPHPVA